MNLREKRFEELGISLRHLSEVKCFQPSVLKDCHSGDLEHSLEERT
jgi:hypothetical protein